MVKLSTYRDTTATMLDTLVGDGSPRPYLGCSQLGHKCPRYLWFSFRWCFKDEIPARLKRLFWRGHREEPEIIKELEQIGIKCYDDQAECIFVNGHVKGHCDGKCIGVIEAPKTEHLLEFKTMNQTSFKDLQKKGVKLSKPIYYAQLQVYMLGLELTRALFITVNKNDDNYYIERVKFDKGFAQDLIRKASSIVLSEYPESIHPPFGSSWYECKWCSAKGLCFEGHAIEQTCRTCSHADIVDGGEWFCQLADQVISVDRQRKSCTEYIQVEL